MQMRLVHWFSDHDGLFFTFTMAVSVYACYIICMRAYVVYQAANKRQSGEWLSFVSFFFCSCRYQYDYPLSLVAFVQGLQWSTVTHTQTHVDFDIIEIDTRALNPKRGIVLAQEEHNNEAFSVHARIH